MSMVGCTPLYHQHALGLLFSDDERNLCVLGYKPRVRSVANSSSQSADGSSMNSTITTINSSSNSNNYNDKSTLFSGVITSNSTFTNDSQVDNRDGNGAVTRAVT